MKKIITLHQINLPDDKIYYSANYAELGFYIVNNNQIVFVNGSAVCFIGMISQYGILFTDAEQKNEIKNESLNISEDFVLKLIAISNNKEKFSDLK